MYKELVELNDKEGLVSNENGNISLVRKESDEYSFDDILNLETELEKKQRYLSDVNYKLSENKLKCSMSKMISILEVVMEVLILLISIGYASPLRIVITMILSYLSLEGLTCCMLASTRKSRKKEQQELLQALNELESEIPLIEKKLKEMEEKVNYTTENISKKVLESDNQEKIYHDFSLDEEVLNKPKVKVKS